MRLNRGCGCLLLGLAALNLLFVVGAIIGIVSGELTIQYGMLVLVLFGANLSASLMLGLAGLRGQPLGGQTGASEAESVSPEESIDGADEEGGE